STRAAAQAMTTKSADAATLARWLSMLLPFRLSTNFKGVRKAEESFLEDGHIQSIGNRRLVFFGHDQARLAQDAEVARQRRLGEIKMLRDFASSHLPLAQQLQDAAAGRVGQCFEYLIHVLYFAKYRNSKSSEKKRGRTPFLIG